MTKKEWKVRFYDLESKHKILSSKFNILTYQHKIVTKDLTTSILTTSKTLELVEDQEFDRLNKLISKYSKLKQEHEDQAARHYKQTKQLKQDLKEVQDSYDDLLSSL